MTTNNLDVRLVVAENGLHYKDIAKKMGVLNTSLSRMMGKDLKPAQRARILFAVHEMVTKNNSDRNINPEMTNTPYETITAELDEEMLNSMTKETCIYCHDDLKEDYDGDPDLLFERLCYTKKYEDESRFKLEVENEIAVNIGIWEKAISVNIWDDDNKDDIAAPIHKDVFLRVPIKFCPMCGRKL